MMCKGDKKWLNICKGYGFLSSAKNMGKKMVSK